jgi:hypothetical protein
MGAGMVAAIVIVRLLRIGGGCLVVNRGRSSDLPGDARAAKDLRQDGLRKIERAMLTRSVKDGQRTPPSLAAVKSTGGAEGWEPDGNKLLNIEICASAAEQGGALPSAQATIADDASASEEAGIAKGSGKSPLAGGSVAVA